MRYCCAATVAACLCLSLPAGAGVIIGNALTPANNLGSNFGLKAVGFTTGASDLDLTSVEVLLGASGLGAGSVIFNLYNDNAGVPGSSIASVGTGTLNAGDPSSIFTFSSLAVLLNASTTYWLVASFDTSNGPRWDQANPPAAPSSGLGTYIGYQFDSTGTGTSWVASGTFNAVEIDGTAVPEPSSIGLLLLGGALLACRRIR